MSIPDEPVDSPQWLTSHTADFREIIHSALKLSLRERDVLDVIVTWSFALGRKWASFETVADLRKLGPLLAKMRRLNPREDT